MTPGVKLHKRAGRQAAALLLIALVPALLTMGFHPRRPKWSREQALAPEVAVSEVRNWSGEVLFVDARGEAAFRRRHIPGAVLLNEDRWQELFPEFIEAWRPDARLVVYCDNRDCGSSQAVARRIRRELGVSEVFTLKGGWDAWLAEQPSGK